MKATPTSYMMKRVLDGNAKDMRADAIQLTVERVDRGAVRLSMVMVDAEGHALVTVPLERYELEEGDTITFSGIERLFNITLSPA